jgi:hypothetical protein
MAKDKTTAECTRMCVKDGMKYALAAEKKVYTLEGHKAPFRIRRSVRNGWINGIHTAVRKKGLTLDYTPGCSF